MKRRRALKVMKQFAITPDNFRPEDVFAGLQELKNQGVYCLYLRAEKLRPFLKDIIPVVAGYGIIPLVRAEDAESLKEKKFGIHFRGSETGSLSEHCFPEAPLVTVSCHDLRCAAEILEKNSECHVFISPVFRPYSKTEDHRELIDRQGLKKLSACFGVRVVLLGGLNRSRVRMLRSFMGDKFSVAGISMFFGGPTAQK